jgi:hypothetical protein
MKNLPGASNMTMHWTCINKNRIIAREFNELMNKDTRQEQQARKQSQYNK